MSKNLVIVAIPEKDDRVWKISSEKVPHLTLLFLGDAESNPNVEEIMKFVQHAVNVSEHGPFYLDVDHRDVLGVDQADVLFFSKRSWNLKWIKHFRHQLLQNDAIRAAYESVQDQFPEWRPHLTLGYPESPAVELPDDGYNHPIYSVSFDRIAVWTGDFEGPDFRLEWPERADEELPIMMSSLNQARVQAGLEAVQQLKHHGVKGMKWGVRKVDNGGEIRINQKNNRAALSSESSVALLTTAILMPPVVPALFLSKRFRSEVKAARAHNKGVIADKKWNQQLSSAKKGAEVHNMAAAEINKKLPGFNDDKRWKDAVGTSLDLTKNPKKQQEYNRAVEDEILNPEYAKAAIKVHGATSPGGRYKLEIEDHGTATLKVRDLLVEDRAAKHDATSANQELSVRFKITRDPNGLILGFVPEEDDLQHAIDLGEEFLEHHGVKGMRWGQRKARPAGSPGKAKKVGRGLKTVAKDIYFETEWSKDSARSRVSTAASQKWANEDIPRINAKYKDTGHDQLKKRLKNPLDPKTVQYRSESRAAFRDRLNEEVANLPTNASRSRRYDVEDNGKTNANYFWDIKVVDVKKSSGLDRIQHAADANADVLVPFRVRPLFDDDGFIIGFEQVPLTLEHSVMALGEAFVEEFLEHYGVPGMKWGVRRGRFQSKLHERRVTAEAAKRAKRPTKDVAAYPTIGKSKRRKAKVDTRGGQDHPPTDDAVKVAVSKQKLKKSGIAALSNNELQDVQRRLNLENDVTRLMKGNRTAGQKFVDGLFGRGNKDDRKHPEYQLGDTARGVAGAAIKKRAA